MTHKCIFFTLNVCKDEKTIFGNFFLNGCGKFTFKEIVSRDSLTNS